MGLSFVVPLMTYNVELLPSSRDQAPILDPPLAWGNTCSAAGSGWIHAPFTTASRSLPPDAPLNPPGSASCSADDRLDDRSGSTYGSAQHWARQRVYIGILPRLYKNTALCAQLSDYQYNGGRATGFDVPVYAKCGSGAYNSCGVTKAWTGSNFAAYYTFRSPNVNYPP